MPADGRPSYTCIYLYIFLAVEIRAQALAAGSIPRASRCTAPGRIFGMGGLHAACRCMRAHTHGQTDGQRCPLHLTIQFRLSFNPFSLADEGWGSTGIGQHAAGGASVGMGGCGWTQGHRIVPGGGDEEENMKHRGMEGAREGAGEGRVEEVSDGERGWWGVQAVGGMVREWVDIHGAGWLFCVAALLLQNGNGDRSGGWVRDTCTGEGGRAEVSDPPWASVQTHMGASKASPTSSPSSHNAPFAGAEGGETRSASAFCGCCLHFVSGFSSFGTLGLSLPQ